MREIMVIITFLIATCINSMRNFLCHAGVRNAQQKLWYKREQGDFLVQKMLVVNELSDDAQ